MKHLERVDTPHGSAYLQNGKVVTFHANNAPQGLLERLYNPMKTAINVAMAHEEEQAEYAKLGDIDVAKQIAIRATPSELWMKVVAQAMDKLT